MKREINLAPFLFYICIESPRNQLNCSFCTLLDEKVISIKSNINRILKNKINIQLFFNFLITACLNLIPHYEFVHYYYYCLLF